MQSRLRWGSVLLLAWGVWVAGSRPAHAYLDPGTGSYLVQLAIASLIAVPFAVKGFFGRLFRRNRQPKDSEETTE